MLGPAISLPFAQPAHDGPESRRRAKLITGLLLREMDQPLRVAIEEALRDDLFATREGLTSEQAAQLSYARARFLARHLRALSFEIAQNPRSLFLLHELLGPVDGTACTILGIHFCLAIGSITTLGPKGPELDLLLDELLEMRSVGVFLATELGYGNSVMSLETTAHYEHETREFVLDSPSPKSRKFMPNTAYSVGKIAVVMAKLMTGERDCGVFPFVVRLRGSDGKLMPGISVSALTEKPGYSLDNGITAFEGVRVPKALWLCGSDSAIDASGQFHSKIPSRRGRFLAAMDRVQTGRVCFTSGAAAFLRTATWIATRYANQRLVSAPRGNEITILRYRNVQADIFRALSEAYALTFAVRALQTLFAERPSEAETFSWVAILKVIVTERVAELLPKLRERCGAVGMLSSNRIIDYWVQVQGIITAEGDNHLMLLKVGRRLLDSVDASDATDSVGSSGQSRPVFDAGHPGSVQELLRYRESRLHQELREQVALNRTQSRDPFLIWNSNVSAVMDLARAYGERIVAERFYEAVSRLDAQTQCSVMPLLHLWSLNEMKSSAAWFLAEGCIDEEFYRKIPEHTDQLLGAIEGSWEVLLDGLGVDNAIVRAPIAGDYVEYYDKSTGRVPPSGIRDRGSATATATCCDP